MQDAVLRHARLHAPCCVTRAVRRASAPTPATRSRDARRTGTPASYRSCSPRFSRVSLGRRDAAPFSRARGRRRLRRRQARAPGPDAINAGIVNERQPRPGGWRPLIGRARTTTATLTGAALHALGSASALSRGCGVLRATTHTACKICVHLSVDTRA